MTARVAARNGFAMLYLPEERARRVLAVLKLAAARIKDTDPEVARMYVEDADDLEKQLLTYF